MKEWCNSDLPACNSLEWYKECSNEELNKEEVCNSLVLSNLPVSSSLGWYSRRQVLGMNKKVSDKEEASNMEEALDNLPEYSTLE